MVDRSATERQPAEDDRPGFQNHAASPGSFLRRSIPDREKWSQLSFLRRLQIFFPKGPDFLLRGGQRGQLQQATRGTGAQIPSLVSVPIYLARGDIYDSRNS